jgi:RNA polymerase sigma-70 factor, ECF subfamily
MNPPSKEEVGPPLLDVADEELMRLAVEAPEGDLRPFEQLVQRYQTRVVANCRYITRDPNNAEDLAQEVMVKVFFGLHGFEGRSSFRYWLQRIKVNHCLNHLKKREGRSYVDIDDAQADGFDQLQVQTTAERQAEAISDQRLIGRVLDSMSKTLRIPLLLCDMDELPYEEVAKALGISLSAAKMRIKRGREEFRQRYESLRTAGREASRR